MGKHLFFGGDVQLFGNNGDPLAGGKVTFYEPGTSTKKDVYTDSTLATAHANPVILDANGRKAIWLNGDYKVKVEDSLDNLIYDEDNINPSVSTVTGNFNLVQNGSFEDNAVGDGKTPDSWTLTEESGSTVILDSTDQHHGAKAIKFTSAGSGGGNVETTSFFEVTPDRPLCVSLFMKSSVADVRNVVSVEWFTSAQASISTTSMYDESTVNPTAFAKIVLGATPPATARYAKLKLTGCHSSDATTGSTWFDDVLVTVTPQIPQGTLGQSVTFTAAGLVEGQFAVPRGYIDGLVSSNNGSDADAIDIAAGIARDSGDQYNLRLASAVGKALDVAWETGGTPGSPTGGLFSGATYAANTWYHGFLIREDIDLTQGDTEADATVEVGFDDNINVTNIPSGYTAFRRICSVLTDGTPDILGFIQVGDWFYLDVAIEDFDGSPANTSVTVSTPPGLTTLGVFNIHSKTDTRGLIWSPLLLDQTYASESPSGGNFGGAASGMDNILTADQVMVLTNTTPDIKYDSAGGGQLNIFTAGWCDFRGAG